ncbi:hypothetical protein BLOT_011665 [Blomia tropicalis]|nr:hypothetical protein BLOT_011665 [Blomia tropicalis]
MKVLIISSSYVIFNGRIFDILISKVMMAIVQLVITRHDKRLLLSQFHIDDARHVILNVGRQNNYDSNQLLDKTKPTRKGFLKSVCHWRHGED